MRGKKGLHTYCSKQNGCNNAVRSGIDVVVIEMHSCLESKLNWFFVSKHISKCALFFFIFSHCTRITYTMDCVVGCVQISSINNHLPLRMHTKIFYSHHQRRLFFFSSLQFFRTCKPTLQQS